MRAWWKSTGPLLAAVTLLAAGCAWTRPPYANDPLLRRRSDPRPLLDRLVLRLPADPQSNPGRFHLTER